MKIIYTPEFEQSLKRLIRRERWSFVNPFEYRRRIKRFIQRGKRGYSDADLWNADQHIAETALAFLRKETMGIPYGLTEKKWEQYRTEMIWLMEESLDLNNTPAKDTTSDEYLKRYKKAKKIFGDYWTALWY